MHISLTILINYQQQTNLSRYQLFSTPQHICQIDAIPSLAILANQYSFQSMFNLSIVCPHHRLPYEHVVVDSNQSSFLRCRNCPFYPTSFRILTDLEHMATRMGAAKTANRIKSKSKSKQELKLGGSDQSEEEVTIIQKIAEEQVRTIELTMKLLTEDKKKNYEPLEKAIAQHKKSWQQYSQSTRDYLFLNKICANSYICPYMAVIGKQGWANFNKAITSTHNRSYICTKIINQSRETRDQLKKSTQADTETVLKTLQMLVSNHQRMRSSLIPEKKQPECKPKSSSSIKNRSKSFGAH